MTPSPRLLALLDSAREDRGVKLGWLADQADYTATVLSSIRGGARPPASLDRLLRLIDAAGGTGEDRAIIIEQLAAYDAAQRDKTSTPGAA